MTKEGKIAPLYLEEEMKNSYLNYAMSVIVGRALPSVQDGLKPVQRRILYAMQDLGLASNKPHKKSARVVGETLGKYHPHGDIAIYDALVRMAQQFSLRYPLVGGQGNFGSTDGDPPAAMRYTEVKLTPLAEEMLEDLDKETVDFAPNFDNSLQEPSLLPAKVPNLLLNGSSGIAVGMATNIPPHNLNELIDACTKMIDNPDISLEEILNIVKAPDFPTGGIIVGKRAIKTAYREGRGKITLRGRASIESKDGKERIIITELPYQVNKAKLVEIIADLSQNNRIIGIRTLRDESDRKGTRVVVDLLRGMSGEIVLNQLYKYTPLQTTFGVILLALVDGKPRLLNLAQMIKYYLEYRLEVVTRRTQFLLSKEKRKAHLLEGLRKALDKIDKVIQIIRASSDTRKAREALIKLLDLTKLQAQAILEMRLQRLTGLEREKIEKDYQLSVKKIEEMEEMLAHKEKLWATIKKELKEIKKKYGDKRRTKVERKEKELMFKPEDLIKKEEVVITATNKGYIKYTLLKAYRRQGRGGKGARGMTIEKEDFVEDLLIANTHSTLLFFTNLGKVHWTRVYEIPQKKRSAKGRALVNFLSLGENERVTTTVAIDDFDATRSFLMVTRKGVVKKTLLSAYSRPQKGGIIGINLRKKDKLIKVLLVEENQDVVLSTKQGKAIQFSEKDIRPTGRASIGVKGISLGEEDEIRDAVIAEKNLSLLAITSKGYGKRTLFKKYRKTKRGGKGVINIRLALHKGEVVGAKKVSEDDEILVITKKGKSIRLAARGVSLMGRATSGLRLIRLEKDDEVIALT
jgi:DNA gyrase subunit A